MRVGALGLGLLLGLPRLAFMYIEYRFDRLLHLLRDVACDHEKRNSFTMAGPMMRVQPPTRPFDFITWSPKADVPVPSTTPPKAPGMKRLRFE